MYGSCLGFHIFRVFSFSHFHVLGFSVFSFSHFWFSGFSVFGFSVFQFFAFQVFELFQKDLAQDGRINLFIVFEIVLV